MVMGRNGYGPKWSWAEMVMGRNDPESVKPNRARLDYHISVIFMIFRCLFFRRLHDFFMIVVLLSFII